MGLRTRILRVLRARRPATKPPAPELTEPTIGVEQTVREIDLARAVQRLVVDDNSALSTIETLPTELVEQIASYLIDDYKPAQEYDETSAGFEHCMSFGGLLEFRQTSRAIQHKTELLFARCFETHIVTFTDSGILRLLDLATCEHISFRIRSLIFAAPDTDCDSAHGHSNALYADTLTACSQDESVCNWLQCNPINTSILAAAMKRLRLLSIFVAPSLVKQRSMSYRQRHWGLDTHPPTVVFNAMILSGVRLEKFDMGIPGWGQYTGMIPVANCLNVFPIRTWVLEDLTSITLVLAKPKSAVKTPAQLVADLVLGHLPNMLGNCWNIRKIEFGLDKATIEDDWRTLTNAHSVWAALSVLRFWNLQSLKLSGFALDPGSLSRFLIEHKQSLVSLDFSNCYLAGCWRAALYRLHELPNIRVLKLDQVTMGLRRILWSTPVEYDNKSLLDEDRDEWVYIGYAGYPDIYLEFREQRKEESVRELMGIAFDTMHVCRRLADPFAEDALDWDWHCLPG